MAEIMHQGAQISEQEREFSARLAGLYDHGVRRMEIGFVDKSDPNNIHDRKLEVYIREMEV